MENRQTNGSGTGEGKMSGQAGRSSQAEAELLSYARKQYRMSQITAACSIAVLCIVLLVTVIAAPRVMALYDDLQRSARNLSSISEQLASEDLSGMVKNVGDLVVTSQKDLDTAMEKVNSIDFDTLNESIQSLHDILKPIGDFFGKLKV